METCNSQIPILLNFQRICRELNANSLKEFKCYWRGKSSSVIGEDKFFLVRCVDLEKKYFNCLDDCHSNSNITVMGIGLYSEPHSNAKSLLSLILIWKRGLVESIVPFRDYGRESII